jgi:DNA-directed RNA polymerase subunit A'
MVISKYVSKIKFGLVSPSVTKKMGVVNIITPEIYDSDGYPVEKGLMDPAMGVIDPGLSCRTCGGRMKNCSGHFGYINLSKPVIHILYKDHIYDFIRATCKSCGHVPLPESKKQAFLEKIETARNDLEQSALQKQVRDFVKSVANVKKCHNCNEAREKVKFNKPQTYMYGDERLWPNDLLEWLEKIPDEDVKLFGMTSENARPEWMILTTLMVPPITMRPSITLETGERSEDDLTHKLSDVVRVNQRLLENVNAGAPEIIVEDLWDLLQYHVTTYFNNEISGVPPARHRTRRQLKTLSQRLKGKQGIFRQNLSGKRVNFCARSVISPDAHINVNEVGVPKKYCIRTYSS